MKILLDECVPRKLAAELQGHDVSTVQKMGWAGIRNGDLLALIEKQFEVFVTVDRNLAFQQNVAVQKFKVIVLHAKSNRFDDLKKCVPAILNALEERAKENVIHIPQH